MATVWWRVMKILKRLLMGIGVLAVGLVGIIGYAFLDAAISRDDNQKFVEHVLTDFSESWTSNAIADRLTETNRAELARAERSSGFLEIAKLGRLVKIDEARLVRHSVTAAGKLTVLELAGVYENGRAKIQAAVVYENASRKLAGLGILLDGPVKSVKIKL